MDSRKFIPSLFTLLNAVCGFISIIESSAGHFEQAMFFIAFAALFDAFDGMVARILKTSSEFGVELDSLSDVISFGAAPSFLLYAMHFNSYDGAGIFLSSLILTFAAIRLARFNIELVGFDKNVFYGVPVPLSAITIISYLYFYDSKVFYSETNHLILIILTILLSLLMVSKFRYPTLPKFTKRNFKKDRLKIIALTLFVIISILSKGYAIFILCILYVLSGIVLYLINKIKNLFRVR